MEHNSPSDHDRLFLRHLSATVVRGGTAGRAVAPEVTPLALAAWLDHRLSEDEATEVEDSLTRDSELLDDLLAVSLDSSSPATADPALIERLCGLVGSSPRTAQIIPIRNVGVRRTAVAWLSWGAVAASVAVVSLVGFNLGSIVGKTEIAQTTTPETTLVLHDDFD